MIPNGCFSSPADDQIIVRIIVIIVMNVIMRIVIVTRNIIEIPAPFHGNAMAMSRNIIPGPAELTCSKDGDGAGISRVGISKPPESAGPTGQAGTGCISHHWWPSIGRLRSASQKNWTSGPVSQSTYLESTYLDIPRLCLVLTQVT